MNRNSIVIRLTLAFTLMFAFSLALSSVASAHAELKSSSPSDGSTLTSAPSSVSATFSEDSSVEQSYIRVYMGSTQVDNGDGKVDANDRTKMSVSLKSGLGDGVYTVKWHTVTEDDNGIEDGRFSFTVAASASTTSNTSSTLPTTGGGSEGILIIALLALCAIVGGFATLRFAHR